MNKKQKVVVLGAGESGNGAAILAQKMGYPTFVSDNGVIKEKYKEELNMYGVEWEEEGHSFKKIIQADIIVKSPGIPNTIDLIKQLRQANKEIISEIEWAYRHIGNSKILAITGSNGKSTTTALTYHLLKEGGKNVAMVGNIGYSFAKQVALQAKEWYVIEVSSFQLDDIAHFRPDIAVLLNITPDHLDRYAYDMSQYIKSKFKIAQNQTKKDVLIVNADDKNILNYLNYQPIKPKLISITMEEKNMISEEGAFKKDDALYFKYDGEEIQQSIRDLMIRGQHNEYNTMAGGISARAADIRSSAIRESFSTFNGLEHRLEYVATIRGVEFINDSKATNLNSVWYALESMTKQVILILGGQDKGNNYEEIMELVKEKVRAIVCMGKNNEPIINAFEKVIEIIADTDSAEDAVKAAYALAEKDDVVLLSPGCASFDLFKDFEDRGNQFVQAVKNL